MDYRKIPGATGRQPCGRCRAPLREPGGRARDLVGASALYLLAGATLGVPLASPELGRAWLVVNVALALLVGCLVATLRCDSRWGRCPASRGTTWLLFEAGSRQSYPVEPE